MKTVLIRSYILLGFTTCFNTNSVSKLEPFSTRGGVTDKTSNRTESKVPIKPSRESPCCKQPPEPPEPGLCCMTGCANCVWIRHVEQLLDFYQDKGKDAAKEALEKVPDENLKAFLKIELDLGK